MKADAPAPPPRAVRSPGQDRRALGWTAAALAGAMLLNADHMPAWIALTALLLLAWRLAAARLPLPVPGTLLRAVLALALVAAVLAGFHTLNGLAAGTALLGLMAALKLFETQRRRDRFVLLGAALFLLLAACLDRQDLARTPLYLGELWLCCAALAIVAAPGFPGRAAFALAARTLLLALPLAVLLFLFFPRLQGSFWALPRGDTALSGLSDTMSPGSIGELTTSYDVAFRVMFTGPTPPPEQRYWRGPVLEDFDGFTWARGTGAWRTRAPLAFAGPAYRYRVALEPSRHPYWFALDTPARAPESGVTLTHDYELVAARAVSEPTSFEGLSYAQTRATAPLSAGERREDSALPAGRNPRALQLGEQLRRRAGSDGSFVTAVLELLRTGGFVYSLEPERLGTDQVDDFLFRTRTGFCGHYASAFVTLMRAGGVPARVVTGYLGGEWNPVGGYFMVRQSDAHAWTEVWLEDRGWTRIDPTAVVEPERLRRGILDLLGNEISVRERVLHGSVWLTDLLQRWDAANAWWNERVVKFDYAAQLRVLDRLGVRSPGVAELGWAFSLALLAWLAVIAWHMGRGARRARPDRLARAYARLCRKLARTGLERAAHQGPLGYRAALAAHVCAAPPAGLALLERYAQLRYGAPVEATRARDVERFRRAVARLRVAR
jgi:protein-glutamine gamma-glutamyltransferase